MSHSLASIPLMHTVDISMRQQKYRSRLIVNKGNTFIVLPVKEIAYFHVEGNALSAIGFDKKQYLLNTNMRLLEEELDPRIFFRSNRQFLLNIACIKRFELYFNGRLVVKTIPVSHEKIIVSRQNANKFKEWIDS
ncbi:LytTR family transcriptional regulator [Carboxylicivirga sp. A043]|uniref:LytR/AlgR family response regulator transcription factor n=1 Tax=Carboxylicivirga litoralis TaxID=2816963 RepID=UPI0021CAF069|nr:LytTR family DNA-binding domain-containing protein [Carboxylicivirga sp. A043]MCU4157270.1 LytTR family transcriptional regulator [Carboxylicivirga sp. A043]